MQGKFDGDVYNIKIAEHSSKLTKNGAILIRVIDEEGKKYSFFSTKMDGSPTAAYRVFETLGNPVGKIIEVGVKSEEAEFEGKPFTRNKILFLKEVKSDGNHNMNSNGTFKPGEGSLKEEIPFLAK